MPSLQEQARLHRPSSRDGKGTAVLTPNDPVRVLQRGSWSIHYVAGPEGILPNGGVLIHVSPFWRWTEPQTITSDGPGFVTAEATPSSVSLEVDTTPELHMIHVRFLEGGLPAGGSLTVIYGAGQGTNAGARADVYAEENEDFFVKVDGDGDGYFVPLPLSEQPTLTILPSSPVRLLLTTPSRATPGSSFLVRIAALDRFDNYASDYSGEAILSVESMLGESSTNAQAKASPPDSSTDPSSQAVSLEQGLATARLSVSRSGIFRCVATSPDFPDRRFLGNPLLVEKEIFRWNQYWGDLHGHSNLSDGSASPEQYFRYARDVSGLDVVALTDHDAFGVFAIDEFPEVWKHLGEAAAQFYRPGSFVTFAGYEWTNWVSGHRHVLFRGGPPYPLFSSRDEDTDTPEELWEALRPLGAMTIPHHPAGGPVSIDWDHHDSAMEPVVEISSIHGVSERPGSMHEIYHAVPGSYVIDAWRRGYRLGVIGSGDTHNGHPGQGDPFSPNSGLACFYSAGCSREEVWESLRSRRVYATTGQRIILEFWANETFLGGEVETPVDVPIRVRGLVVGTAPLRTIEVFLDDAVVRRESAEGAAAVLSFDLQGPHRSGSFLYMKASQVDDAMAWSSPIWILALP